MKAPLRERLREVRSAETITSLSQSNRVEAHGDEISIFKIPSSLFGGWLTVVAKHDCLEHGTRDGEIDTDRRKLLYSTKNITDQKTIRVMNKDNYNRKINQQQMNDIHIFRTNDN